MLKTPEITKHYECVITSTNHVHGGGVEIADVAEELSDDGLLVVDLGELLRS